MTQAGPVEMKYVKPVQNIIDTILETASGIDIVPTFVDGPKSVLSCIVHELGTEKYGLVSVNVDGYDNDVNCFVFNGKLYDYCRAEGFSQEQMISDQSFENKVLTAMPVDDFVETFTGNNN
jgi:hypothetical protein